MKQIVINPSDTMQILSNNAEKYTLSSRVAECFTGLVDSFSRNLFFNWLDGLHIIIALLAIVFIVSIWKPKAKIVLFRHLKVHIKSV